MLEYFLLKEQMERYNRKTNMDMRPDDLISSSNYHTYTLSQRKVLKPIFITHYLNFTIQSSFYTDTSTSHPSKNTALPLENQWLSSAEL